jgi:acyl homoserine lactone synthase
MIYFFHGRDRNRFSREADQMYRLRARQFHERLKWDVAVKDGWESDAYDELNPLYLVSKSETGSVVGALRFLPTTGPTMMRDVFDQYFDAPFEIESPLIWECSRFAVETAASDRWTTPTGLCRATFELLQGGCEIALRAGVAQVVGVFDQYAGKVYRRSGWKPEIIARSDKPSTGTIHVGIWDVSEDNLAAMREQSGLTGSVLAPSQNPFLNAAA